MAKLLNRTLLLHPMAPHDKGALYKAGSQPGYVAYNHLTQSDLIPLSIFLDLKQLSQLIPVQEVVTSHHQFYHDFGQLSWRNICHSMGFGYWMDRRSTTVEEISMSALSCIKCLKEEMPQGTAAGRRFNWCHSGIC